MNAHWIQENFMQWWHVCGYCLGYGWCLLGGFCSATLVLICIRCSGCLYFWSTMLPLFCSCWFRSGGTLRVQWSSVSSCSRLLLPDKLGDKHPSTSWPNSGKLWLCSPISSHSWHESLMHRMLVDMGTVGLLWCTHSHIEITHLTGSVHHASLAMYWHDQTVCQSGIWMLWTSFSKLLSSATNFSRNVVFKLVPDGLAHNLMKLAVWNSYIQR